MNHKCTECNYVRTYHHPATQDEPEEFGFECVHHDKAYCLELLEENCWKEEIAKECKYFCPAKNENIDYCWEDCDCQEDSRRSLDDI